jgi:hypothetical protein
MSVSVSLYLVYVRTFLSTFRTDEFLVHMNSLYVIAQDPYNVLTMKFQCDVYFKTFSRKHDLKRQKDTVNNNDKQFSRTKCNK